MESKEVNLPNEYRVTDATRDCPQNYLEEPTSKAIQITGSTETYSLWYFNHLHYSVDFQYIRALYLMVTTLWLKYVMCVGLTGRF
jgi:hypothetical protein